MPVESFEVRRRRRSFASSEQDRSQRSAQNEHASGKPEKQRDPTNRKHWNAQNKDANQRKRRGAYFRRPAGPLGLTAYPGAHAPVNENDPQDNQRCRSRRQSHASGKRQQYEKRSQQKNDGFVQELEKFCGRQHAFLSPDSAVRRLQAANTLGGRSGIMPAHGHGVADME